MEIDEKIANEFAKTLIMRGFGLYGEEKMIKICEDSGITCHPDSTFEKIIGSGIEKIIRQLIINYSKFNLPAKMTSLVLAKKYGISIPDELRSSNKKKTKYRQRIQNEK